VDRIFDAGPQFLEDGSLDTGNLGPAIDAMMTGFDQKFQADMGGARHMAFNADGSLLGCAGISNVVNSFAGQQDPIICVIDWETKKITHHLRTNENKPGVAWGVHFHEAGFVAGCAAGQSNSGTVEFWRLEDPKRKPEENDQVNDSKDQSPVEIANPPAPDPAGKTEGEKEEVSKPIEQKPFHVVKIDKAVRGLDFSPSGRQFAIACKFIS
jgi:hypothetical protein